MMDEDISPVEANEEAESELDSVPHPQPAWVAWVAASMPVLICFLGTGRTPWAHGIAAALIGALALAFPPKTRVPLVMPALAALIVAFTLLPLVPLPWPHWPSWRTALVDDFQLALPSTWSIQPQVTLEAWTGMVVAGLWLFWAAFRPWSSADRTAAVRILAGGLAALAVASLVFRAAGWRPASWTPDAAGLGPYANRNHFSCLMVMATLLCLGAAYELQRRKNRLWMLYALGVIPAFATILLNTSRAGLILFFLALLAWIATSSMRSGGVKKLAVGGSLLLACTAATILFGQFILHRFSKQGSNVAETLGSDTRFGVYSNASRLFAEQPVMGIGLGNFGAVFGMIHHLPNAYLRYRHPESDWLWLLCEAGWPAATAILLGAGFMVSWMGPWRSSSRKRGRRDRRLRTAAGLAFLVSAAHGVADTPNHDLPQLLLVCLVGALALRQHRLASARGAAMPWLFRIGGVAALAASGLWFATAVGMATPFGLSTSQRDLEAAITSFRKGDASRAYQEVNQAIAAAPASFQNYFVRAQIGLKLGRAESEAMADFGRARYLEPHVTHICMEEADTWLQYNPQNAIPAWREVLRRDPPLQLWHYRTILDELASYPQLRPALRDLASTPGMMVIYLALTTGNDFKDTLKLFLQRYPTLEGLTSYERLQFAQSWRNSGDRTQLMAFLAAHPILEKDTWQVKARGLADTGNFEGAYQLLKHYVHAGWTASVEDNTSLQQLEREFQMYPSDARRGFNLYATQRDKGLWDAAVATLLKIADLPHRPRHVYFDLASAYAQKADYAKAWQYAEQYLNSPD